MECRHPVEFGKPIVGEKSDAFLVTLHLQGLDQNSRQTQTRGTGYHEMWSSLWTTQRSQACPHAPRSGEEVMLEPGWVTISGFGDHFTDSLYGLTIFLTSESPPARWNALLSLYGEVIKREHYAAYKVVLRSLDTCFSCAVRQAATCSSKTFLIL